MNNNELANYIGQMILGAMNQSLPAPSVRATLPSIREVIYNEPATIINWSDGVKTVVKCHPEDTYDAKVGFLLCVMKRAYGNTGIYNHVLRDYCFGFENSERALLEKKEEVYLIPEVKEGIPMAQAEVPFQTISTEQAEATHHENDSYELVEKLANAIEKSQEPNYTMELNKNEKPSERLSAYTKEECERRAGEYSEVIPKPEVIPEPEAISEQETVPEEPEHFNSEKETPYHELKEAPFKSAQPFVDPEIFFEELDEEEKEVPNEVHYVPSEERIKKFIFQQV